MIGTNVYSSVVLSHPVFGALVFILFLEDESSEDELVTNPRLSYKALVSYILT